MSITLTSANQTISPIAGYELVAAGAQHGAFVAMYTSPASDLHVYFNLQSGLEIFRVTIPRLPTPPSFWQRLIGRLSLSLNLAFSWFPGVVR